MSNIIKPEILSPAGNLRTLKVAVDYGADSVYFAGREFGMRAAAANFTTDEIGEGVRYAHEHGAKAYLTLNTLPRNNDIDRLPDFIRGAAAQGIDAFIVTDIGVISMCRKYAPNTAVHISVQTGIVNYMSARAYYEMGAERVVLARELSLEEIAEIRAKTPKELSLEAFAHGAICMAVSGRCLLSSYLTGRDPNRGDCAQPCRWNYHLVEEKRSGEYMQLIEDKDGSYILNAKDMCMIEHLPEMYKAGVDCLKLEGRAKTEYYVAAVTNAYARAAAEFSQTGFDYHPSDELLEEVMKISHREYSTGFYFGQPKDGQVYGSGGYIRDYELVGVVLSHEDGLTTIAQRNRFYPGTLDVLDPVFGQFEIESGTLFDKDMNELECARYAAEPVKFYSRPLSAGAYIRVRK